MEKLRLILRLADTNRPRSIQAILLITILLFDHNGSKTNKVASGQTITTPLLEAHNEPTGNSTLVPLRSFLEPCEVVTLQAQCSEEEYESNEDCLPQKKDNCDRSKELFCLSGVCLPNCHPNKETYDHVAGKCFRKVGSDCRSFNASTLGIQLSLASNDNEGSHENQQQQQHSTVVVPECEKNAVCEKGQCKCAKNFTYDHNFSQCMLTANYADFCNGTITCDRKSDIVCTENQCQCSSPEIQYFHLKRKRCYILIGQVCSTGLQFCPDNSNCVKNKFSASVEADNTTSTTATEPMFASSSTLTHQPGNSSSVDKTYLRLYEEQRARYDGEGNEIEDDPFIGIWGEYDQENNDFVCKCNRGYGSIRDKRFCLGLHGARCNTLHRCNMERGLKCVDGVCRCAREAGNEQIFSEQFQACITRIGFSCIDNGYRGREEDICPIGGSCTEGKCVCDKGLTPVSSSHPPSMAAIAYSCMKSHGMICKNNSNGDSGSSIFSVSTEIDPFEPPCNHEIGLECSSTEGKCLCRDSNQFYDVRMRKCQNFHGVDTKIPVIHFTPPDDREYNFHRNSGVRVAVGVVFLTILKIIVI